MSQRIFIGDQPTHREKQKRLFAIQLKISPCYLLWRSCLCINILKPASKETVTWTSDVKEALHGRLLSGVVYFFATVLRRWRVRSAQFFARTMSSNQVSSAARWSQRQPVELFKKQITCQQNNPLFIPLLVNNLFQKIYPSYLLQL